MRKDFLKCGMIGWCLEVVWTGIYSGLHHDRQLTATTSLLMFPIYGMAAWIGPISRHMKRQSVLVRGLTYTAGIYLTEFCTGSFLKKYGICPWDYSHCKYNMKGLVRLDYAPAWFLTGLLYEGVLNSGNKPKT